MLWAVPYVDSVRISTEVEGMYNQFLLIYTASMDLIEGGVNSSMYFDIFSDSGIIGVKEGVTFVFMLSEDIDFVVYNLDDSDVYNFTLVTYMKSIENVTVIWINEDIQENITYVNATVGVPVNVTTSYPICGNVKIELTTGNVLMGEVWILDIGSFYYRLRGYDVIFENGGIIVCQPNPYIRMKPPHVKDEFFIQVIQIDPSSSWLLPCEGSTRVKFYLKGDDMLKERVHYFKIQIIGARKDTWLNYFKDEYGLYADPHIDDTLYKMDCTVTLIRNVYEVVAD